jgi:hypothetical protein
MLEWKYTRELENICTKMYVIPRFWSVLTVKQKGGEGYNISGNTAQSLW